MSWDGGTSGEPYSSGDTWPEHREYQRGAPKEVCDCCSEWVGEDALVHVAIFDGMVCGGCRTECFLLDTRDRRCSDLYARSAP